MTEIKGTFLLYICICDVVIGRVEISHRQFEGSTVSGQFKTTSVFMQRRGIEQLRSPPSLNLAAHET